MKAEEKLFKDGAEWLGWKSVDEKFVTCHGTTMEIGMGDVRTVIEKCPPNEGLPTGPRPAVGFLGSIERIDHEHQVIKFQPVKGKLLDFYADKGVIDKWDKVQAAQKSEACAGSNDCKLIVVSPAEGRATDVVLFKESGTDTGSGTKVFTVYNGANVQDLKGTVMQ